MPLWVGTSREHSAALTIAPDFFSGGAFDGAPPGFPVRLAVQVPAQIGPQEAQAVGTGQNRAGLEACIETGQVLNFAGPAKPAVTAYAHQINQPDRSCKDRQQTLGGGGPRLVREGGREFGAIAADEDVGRLQIAVRKAPPVHLT